MKTAWGTITAIEGERFEVRHNGERDWYTLGLDAVIEGGELKDLFRRQVEVTVHYEDIPDETSHVVNRVFPSAKPGFFRQT